MHKKFTVLLATGAMLVTTIVGCAANKPYPTETVPAVEAQAVIAEPAVLATDSNLAIKPSTFTNPAIVFSGDYYSNRATLLVEANGPENVTLTVVIPNSAKTQTILTADAKFNYYTNTVTYVNGTKTLVTLNKNGKAVSEKQVYANGTGSFIFEKGSARWNDHTEKISNMTFKAGTPEKTVSLAKNTKLSKKTTMKTVRIRKAAKKTAKNAPKAKFTYGHSSYSYKNLTVTVYVYANNKVDITATETHYDAIEVKYEITWNASGKLDTKTNTVTYDDCTKKLILRTNPVHTVRTQYSNGKGSITFNGNSLTWNDSKENVAKGITFKK